MTETAPTSPSYADIPIGSTESGRKLLPEEALKMGLIYYQDKKARFMAAIKHEAVSDATAVGTALYFTAKAVGVFNNPLEPQEAVILESSWKSVIAVAPIMVTLIAEHERAKKEYLKLLKIYDLYRKGDNQKWLNEDLHKLDLQLEALPDSINANDFDSKIFRADFEKYCAKGGVVERARAAKGRFQSAPLAEAKDVSERIVRAAQDAASFLGHTAWEGALSLHPKNLSNTVISMGQNIAKAGDSASKTKEHFLNWQYALRDKTRRTANRLFKLERRKIKRPETYPREDHHVKVAAGNTVFKSVWVGSLTTAQAYFVGNAIVGGTNHLLHSEDPGSAALSLAHIASGIFALKPLKELSGEFNHEIDQLNGLRAQTAEKRVLREQLIRQLAELDDEGDQPPPP